MAFFTSEALVVTTSAGGAATAYTTAAFNGLVHAILYTPGTPYDNNVVITVTGNTTGVAIWAETLATASAATARYPRAATHSAAGVASLYAAAGQAVNDKIAVVDELIKITLASGGATKTGTFRFVIGD